jgi:hypothetical protein
MKAITLKENFEIYNAIKKEALLEAEYQEKIALENHDAIIFETENEKKAFIGGFVHAVCLQRVRENEANKSNTSK